MLHSEIVIVGCGNPLFGDDGFGPAVIEEMEKLTLPDNVTIQDGGAGAPHFIFNFLNPEVTKKLIVVDISDFNAKPGSISRISGQDLKPGAYIDPHSWDGTDQLCR
ncbi:MAG: hydrogenase maturation protease, partial [Methanoregula sp.]